MLQRRKTRDLLLEYDKAIMPPRPRAAGLSNIYSWGSTILEDLNGLEPPIPIQQNIDLIYPWENTSLSIFSHQLYSVAIINGFVGTEQEFLDRFVNYNKTYFVLYLQLFYFLNLPNFFLPFFSALL